MSKLFSTIKIKDISFRNRIAVSPMCQYSSSDGYANDWHLVHLGTRAAGGAGLIIQEATGVSPEGRISPGDLGLYTDGHIEQLKRITSFIHQHGSIAAIQLAHAGRKASCARPWDGGRQIKENEGGWLTVSSSPLPFFSDDDLPLALDQAGINKVISDFRDAASRALTAGYQVVEIHAAHGYLIHQFLSPLCNSRNDNYGGTFQNRIRLLLEIVNGVHSVWPQNLPLFVRISATDWVENGWDIDEAVQLCSILKQEGVDLIDCSSAGMVPDALVQIGPGFQVPFAERIKKEAKILTGAVGLITNAKQAEAILNKKQADLILLGRELLRNPYFPLAAAKDTGEDIKWPLQYLRSK